MSYYGRRSNRPRPPAYGPSTVYHNEERGTVHYQTKNIGYGFTHYMLVGTREQIDAEVASTLSRYPNNPYGTSFSWPPEAAGDNKYRMPVDLGDGLWYVEGSHSNTSD